MRPLGTYVTLAMRGATFIIICGVIGGLLGAGAALARPATETSRALTTLTSADVKMPVESVYSVNQMIRVTMPGYVAYAQDASVIQAAAAKAGIDPGAVSKGLTVVRQPDASVIEWTLRTDAGGHSQEALSGALAQFDKVVAQSSPKAENGQPLVKVVDNQPASVAAVSRVSPVLAAIAGAVAGLLAGLAVVIYRGTQAKIVTSRDSIELDLDTPVVAEIGGDDESRDRGWRYAAASVARDREPRRLLLLGGSLQPSEEDASRLADAVRDVTAVMDPEVVRRELRDANDVAELAGVCDGVIVCLVKGRDSTVDHASEVQGLHHVCKGPVVAVLDSSAASMAAGRRRGGRPDAARTGTTV